MDKNETAITIFLLLLTFYGSMFAALKYKTSLVILILAYITYVIYTIINLTTKTKTKWNKNY